MMALIYLFHEFGDVNIKVTTILSEKGSWQGKVILEDTTEKPKDDEDFAKFYTLAYCNEIENKG